MGTSTEATDSDKTAAERPTDGVDRRETTVPPAAPLRMPKRPIRRLPKLMERMPEAAERAIGSLFRKPRDSGAG